MAITFDLVSWETTPDRVNPKQTEVATFERAGAEDTTTIKGAKRYLPQKFGVFATVANTTAAAALIAAAEAQEDSNVILTDQFGVTHSVSVITFTGIMTVMSDGNVMVSGSYHIVKYTP